MLKKVLLVFVLLGVVAAGTVGFVIYKTNKDLQKAGVVLSPFELTTDLKSLKSVFGNDGASVFAKKQPLGNPINIVLLGIDRRSREEGYRTDIMILLSANPETNKVVLASIPRDLWVGNGRINATFLQDGWEGMQSAVETITGQKPTKYILTDFRDFSWIVDAMGGVPVDVQTTFTDSQYPVDETKGYQTVSFKQGTETLTGERALIFARSRKGDNDNGDWGRMKRQHLILKGMLGAVLQPSSIFNPMVVENAYTTVTTGKMDTNLSLEDAKYLWDFYKDKDKYTFESVYLDYEYLFTPPMEDYGGAWVLAPKNGTFEPFKTLINNKIHNIPEAVPTPETVTIKPTVLE
ncbi:LCP family protein [Patescibacteria group bacterium]|nr:LCP family protein [Patescibacteria group bacterium]